MLADLQEPFQDAQLIMNQIQSEYSNMLQAP